jgi:membrane protein DedA with SNARE-associated domain
LIEDLIQFLLGLDPVWIYLAAAAIAFVENIFPPFPSDIVLVAIGSLVGLGTIDFSAALGLASLGGTLGFVTMYKIGDWFGLRILETGKIRFIPLDQVHKVEHWFKKYGYVVVVANRFLSGTRAVISFFAGMSELSLMRCTILSAVSALAWNGILLFAGKELGQNWKVISSYFETYGRITTILLAIALVVAVVRMVYNKHRRSKSREESPAVPPST